MLLLRLRLGTTAGARSKAGGDHPCRLVPEEQLDEEEAFGVSVTTVSGQRCAFGTSRQPFVAGELTSSLNYCLAQDLRGEEAVHSHIGHEPSGRGAEEMTLNDDDRPHNPFVSTGAIVSCALIHPQEPMDVRFDFMAKKYRDAASETP